MFWVLALFGLAVAFTLAARLDQGYVIVVFPPWRMEVSFMLALALLCGFIGAAYLLTRLAQTALRLPEDMRAWRARKRREKADHALLEALRAHLDGDDRKARHLAAKARESMAPDLAERLSAPEQRSLPL
ncbi:MAG: heme biosynthesis HemY N-terminal domain-containing protein [Betaproteobacteria bacterium]|nr:heme biosynthesis HemY N-terminal domain-containing protein [Betaproteobacteria bacterium]